MLWLEESKSKTSRIPWGRIHPYRVDRRKIDHEAVVADGKTGHIVTAAAHRYQQIVGSGESHCIDNVGDPGSTGNERGPLVDHTVPGGARTIVAVIAGAEQRTAQA